MSQDDIIRLAAHCDRVLDLKNAKLSDEYFYQSLPFCVIDAIYSIGVKFEGTRQTVMRYCDCFNIQRIRNVKTVIPATEKQESIERIIEKMESAGIEFLTEKVFDNRQRTSSKSGILKSEAVLKFAKILKKYGVNYLQDIPKVMNDESFEQEIKTIPGQRSGISLKYFFMLSRSENLIKPDRHIKAFVRDAIVTRRNLRCAQGKSSTSHSKVA